MSDDVLVGKRLVVNLGLLDLLDDLLHVHLGVNEYLLLLDEFTLYLVELMRYVPHFPISLPDLPEHVIHCDLPGARIRVVPITLLLEAGDFSDITLELEAHVLDDTLLLRGCAMGKLHAHGMRYGSIHHRTVMMVIMMRSGTGMFLVGGTTGCTWACNTWVLPGADGVRVIGSTRHFLRGSLQLLTQPSEYSLQLPHAVLQYRVLILDVPKLILQLP